MANNTRTPWAWIPSLYFAEGLPYVVVMTVSVIMYKRLGISNTDIALYTSWLYLPWVIKPFWSPLVDLMKTKRWWITIMQLFIGAGLAGIALTIPAPSFFQYTLAFFWLMAFSSATHDIAADGFYMLGLDEHQQAFFVGIRSTFYRLAMITGQGLLIILAGSLESRTGLEPVRFEVRSSVNQTSVSDWNIESEIFNAVPGAQKFILSSEEISISTQNISSDQANELKELVKSANLQNMFIEEEKPLEAGSPSWWSQSVSTPLKNRLKASWGKQETSTQVSNLVGNIGVIGLRLSSPPEAGKNVVLNIGLKSGDKNFKLIHGERLVFTDKNWNTNAWVLVQVDPKLEEPRTARFEGLSGNIPLAWSVTFYVLTGMFILFFLYHKFILPYPSTDVQAAEGSNLVKEFFRTFLSFLRKENLGPALIFLLVFRLGEGQLVKLAAPFLLDARDNDGLGLTTSDVGLIYGTIGIIFLTIGGILGGYVASKKGLKYWIWWMTMAINLPNLVYVYLSYAVPTNFVLIASAVAIEQFGYGFGFTAYMLFMIMFAEGKSKTAHFAICTGIMALGMMLPGMLSGWLQEIIGYQNFFIWVMICTIPGFLVIRFLKIDPGFGIKKK
jgi:MFS transporter, PAT family, beta-lactamase induction signal transducer AmpG